MAGTLTWNIPGCDVAVERETMEAVRIQTAESQTEIRTLWSQTPRFKYKFTIRGRIGTSGTTYNSGSEVGILRAFYESQSGEWDSWSMTDPLDGATVTCRFLGTMKMKRLMPGGGAGKGAWWELTFEAVTVVNAT